MPTEGELAGVKGQLAAATGSLSHANDQIAALQAALRTLKLSLPATLPSRRGLAKHGLSLELAGPAGRTARVRLLIGDHTAKKLGLSARTIAARNVTIGAGATTSFVIKPTASAAAALKHGARKVGLGVEATTGDRRAQAHVTIGG